MHLNMLVFLEENISGYGRKNKAPTGHVSITSPGVVKCYVQDLRKGNKDYMMYLISKAANKAIRMGKINNPEVNKQTTWKIDMKNLNNTGIQAKDIDCIALVVEGTNTSNTDTIMLGYTKDKYLPTSMIQQALPKAQTVEKAQSVPSKKETPIAEMSYYTKKEAEKGLNKAVVEPLNKPYGQQVNQEYNEPYKQQGNEGYNPEVNEEPEEESEEGLGDLFDAVEKGEEIKEAMDEESEDESEDEPEDESEDENQQEVLKETLDKVVEEGLKDQIEEKIKSIINTSSRGMDTKTYSQKEIIAQVEKALRESNFIQNLLQKDKDLNAQLGVIMSSGVRELDRADTLNMEEVEATRVVDKVRDEVQHEVNVKVEVQSEIPSVNDEVQDERRSRVEYKAQDETHNEQGSKVENVPSPQEEAESVLNSVGDTVVEVIKPTEKKEVTLEATLNAFQKQMESTINPQKKKMRKRKAHAKKTYYN